MSPISISPATTAPTAPDQAKLAAAAKQFEAIFVRQMLSAARKADFGEPLLGGQAMDTFRQMQDERFADIAAERGSFGIAKMLEAQLAQRAPQSSTRSPLPFEGEGWGGGVPRQPARSAFVSLPHPQPLPAGEGGKSVERKR